MKILSHSLFLSLSSNSSRFQPNIHMSRLVDFPIYLHSGTKRFIVPSDRLIVTN